MARILHIQGEVALPKVCAVCLAPAQRNYRIQRTFSYGSKGVEARLEVPLCSRHHALAQHKSRAEKIVGRASLWVGAAAGLAAAAGLLLHWDASSQGSLLPNFLLSLVVGGSIFLILWTAGLFWLAPRFADPESLHVREAVRILRYWPGDGLMEIEVANERVAEMLENAK